jgi:hypothetical protein
MWYSSIYELEVNDMHIDDLMYKEISRDERREKLLQAKKMFAMCRRMREFFPDIADINHEIAMGLVQTSQQLRKEYRK